MANQNWKHEDWGVATITQQCCLGVFTSADVKANQILRSLHLILKLSFPLSLYHDNGALKHAYDRCTKKYIPRSRMSEYGNKSIGEVMIMNIVMWLLYTFQLQDVTILISSYKYASWHRFCRLVTIPPPQKYLEVTPILKWVTCVNSTCSLPGWLQS